MMIIDTSKLRQTASREQRTWHGAAFIVEALVLLVFLMAALAVVIQLMNAAHERGIQADELSDAIVLASNNAEAFAADPTATTYETTFVSENGTLSAYDGAKGAVEELEDTPWYEVARTVENTRTDAGTLYTAHISVSCKGEPLYELDTARYVSADKGVAA